MGQMGFFDIANRYAGLDAKNDPLVKIDEVVPWEDFRPRLEAAWRKPAEERKSPAGRKPWDAVVMLAAAARQKRQIINQEARNMTPQSTRLAPVVNKRLLLGDHLFLT